MSVELNLIFPDNDHVSVHFEAILQGLDDPSSLKDLLPDEQHDEQDPT